MLGWGHLVASAVPCRLVPQRAPQHLQYIMGPGRGIKQETNTAECAWAGAELLPCPWGLARPWHGAWHRITRGTESHGTEHPRDRRLSGLPLTLSRWLPARFQALPGPGAALCYCSGAPPGRSVPGRSARLSTAQPFLSGPGPAACFQRAAQILTRLSRPKK